MKNLFFTAISLIFAISCLTGVSLGQTEPEQPVDFHDGKISVNFEQFPVEAAILLIQARAGLEIVLPGNSKTKFLNLRFNDLQVEPAMRLFVQSIGFRGIALLYDESGRPYRAVAIDTQPEDKKTDPTGGRLTDIARQNLTAEERARLEKQLELWSDLRTEARTRIEDRLKSLPPSTERDDLLIQYARQILGIKN